MNEVQRFFEELYSNFNERNIDAVLAMMKEDVSWPKASEGGRVTGKNEIRSYWTRQWQEFDPIVIPLTIVQAGDRVEVAVRQVVKTKRGEILSDSELKHLYTLVDGLIQRMDLDSPQSASSAFHAD